MEPISQHLQNKRAAPSGNFVHERQAIVQEIVDRINIDRIGTKFRMVTWNQINGMLAHLSDTDLRWFFDRFSKSPAPGRFFFGSLKKK